MKTEIKPAEAQFRRELRQEDIDRQNRRKMAANRLASVKAQHTPGPWKTVRRRSAAGAASRVYVRVADGYGQVAEVFAGKLALCDASVEEINATKIANAHLIEAAPELLDALQDLVDAIWDGRFEAEGAEVFTDPARAAIAKANGGAA